jgi:hypothetical protein
MRRALAIFVVVMIAAGCNQGPAKGGLSFEEQ